mmetsp:Transcript_40576/g.122804  ORF Transcript_40576/g.122804 Transcript_40576/m.122804 type:complete len:260 (-) Transcript_40576:64-843(-)
MSRDVLLPLSPVLLLLSSVASTSALPSPPPPPGAIGDTNKGGTIPAYVASAPTPPPSPPSPPLLPSPPSSPPSPPSPPPYPPALPGATYDIVRGDGSGRRLYPAARSGSRANPFPPADCNSTTTQTGCIALPSTLPSRVGTLQRPAWAGTLHTSHPTCLTRESGARACDDGLPTLPRTSELPVHGDVIRGEQLAAEDLPGGSVTLLRTTSVALGDVDGDGAHVGAAWAGVRVPRERGRLRGSPNIVRLLRQFVNDIRRT